MHSTRIRLAVTTAAGLGVLALAAACGGSGGATAAGPQYAPPAAGASGGQSGTFTSTVSATTVNGGKVLVDTTGAALYTNDQDTGAPKCVSKACTAVWVPLMVPSGQQPTEGPGVGGTIATVAVGGRDQVTLNGKPLYTFALDGPGQAGGNGLGDVFDGTHFTWHSAVPAGATAPSSPASAAGGIPGY
ncbi:MAG TPA: hypothetical protein VFW65_10015 [Pseudonocardiaceae bacterium]|nr:hypothetical protein [Pseudonocardiaceae bacterium]